MPEAKPQTDPTKLEFLTSSLDHRIAILKSGRSWYRRQHFVSRMSTVVLSALITVAAGIGGLSIPQQWLTNLILVLGALTTVVSTWGNFFAPRDSWLLTAQTLASVLALKSRLEFARRGADFRAGEDKIVGDFFAEYQAILTAHNSAWLELRQKLQEPKPPA